jgi:hypothetical protein
MMLSFIWYLVSNHMNVWALGGLLQTNAVIMAVGLFGFIAYRLRAEARARSRQQTRAAAFLIW